MIIFNISALLLGIIFGLSLEAVDQLFPALDSSPYSDLVDISLALVIASAGEFFGLRGRLFFIPVWFIATIIFGIEMHKLFGWYGVSAAGLILGGAIVCLYMKGLKMEREAWEAAPRELERAVEEKNRDPELAWEHLGRAFFVPDTLKASAGMKLHLRRVLELAKELNFDGQHDEELDELSRQIAELPPVSEKLNAKLWDRMKGIQRELFSVTVA